MLLSYLFSIVIVTMVTFCIALFKGISYCLSNILFDWAKFFLQGSGVILTPLPFIFHHESSLSLLASFHVCMLNMVLEPKIEGGSWKALELLKCNDRAAH